MNQKRKKIPHGYEAQFGVKLADWQVDNYNAIQERINSFIEDNRPVPKYITAQSFELMRGYIINGCKS